MAQKLKFVFALFLLIQISQTFGARCGYKPATRIATCEDVNNFQHISSSFRSNWIRVVIKNKPAATLIIPERDNNVGRVEDLDMSEAGNLALSQGGFRAFQSLKRLIITKNSIASIRDNWFSADNNIEFLDLSYNNLQGLRRENMRNFRKVRVLNVTGNDIVATEANAFADMSQLEVLVLAHNRIATLIDLGSVPLLKELDYSENSITEVPNNIFSKQPALEKISLAQNSIQRIRDRAFVGLANLREAKLSGNSLRQIPVDLFTSPLLQILDLSQNDITDIRANTFANLPNLQILNISRNAIRKLDANDLTGLSTLRWLAVDQNDLSSLPVGLFASLPLLERLDLGGNSLQTFSGDVFGENDLPLRILFLRNNNLVDIQANSFAHTPNLEYLAIDHNTIETFDDNLLTNINLKKFHMQHNAVSELSAGFYASLASTAEILMDHNKLAYLPEAEVDFTNLQRLTVEGNPWQCHCLDEIFTFITARGVDYRRENNPFYAGGRPLCVATSERTCIKDSDQVDQLRVRELYTNAQSTGSGASGRFRV